MLSRTVAGNEKKSNFCLAGLMLASAGVYARRYGTKHYILGQVVWMQFPIDDCSKPKSPIGLITCFSLIGYRTISLSGCWYTDWCDLFIILCSCIFISLRIFKVHFSGQNQVSNTYMVEPSQSTLCRFWEMWWKGGR